MERVLIVNADDYAWLKAELRHCSLRWTGDVDYGVGQRRHGHAAHQAVACLSWRWACTLC